jgi:hypothetical protein
VQKDGDNDQRSVGWTKKYHEMIAIDGKVRMVKTGSQDEEGGLDVVDHECMAGMVRRSALRTAHPVLWSQDAHPHTPCEPGDALKVHARERLRSFCHVMTGWTGGYKIE